MVIIVKFKKIFKKIFNILTKKKKKKKKSRACSPELIMIRIKISEKSRRKSNPRPLVTNTSVRIIKPFDLKYILRIQY